MNLKMLTMLLAVLPFFPIASQDSSDEKNRKATIDPNSFKDEESLVQYIAKLLINKDTEKLKSLAPGAKKWRFSFAKAIEEAEKEGISWKDMKYFPLRKKAKRAELDGKAISFEIRFLLRPEPLKPGFEFEIERLYHENGKWDFLKKRTEMLFTRKEKLVSVNPFAKVLHTLPPLLNKDSISLTKKALKFIYSKEKDIPNTGM